MFSSLFRFKVHYYDRNVDSDGTTKVREGEILFIVPRHPDKSVKTSPCDGAYELCGKSCFVADNIASGTCTFQVGCRTETFLKKRIL